MPDYIKDLIELPEQVSRGDFVLRLTEGVTRPDETLRDYVVTKQLVGCFDAALGLIKSALEQRSPKAAYLHGSFGSGKSHFMAVLHLILAGNVKARGIRELSEVIAKHNAWIEGKRILLVPYHLIGARNLESAILGNYAAYIRRTHPNAPTPAVYRSEALLENADAHREALGDSKFFERLNQGRSGQTGSDDGWGNISAGWEPATYGAARNAAPDSEERRRLVGDLVDSIFPAMRETNEFVDLDDGLAVLSAHAKHLGYDAVILFLDELILWLASHAANVDFVSQEAQKVPKLVESERADRPIPIVSFVARQRDLRELVGQHITGAERMSFSDVLSWWEGRFSTINLEDRNLPAIAEKRILRPKSEEARRKMDAEFARTAALREEVKKVLLTSHSNPEDFRKLYPFSPALVETLVAVSSLLQRERTALKIMVQLLVKQRDTLQLGQIVPVGDLYDEIAQGDEAFSTDMKAHFDNAHRLYQQHLRPLLEQEHNLTFEQASELPIGDTRRRALRNDDRLVKTLLLAALAPEVDSLKQMTPARLAALNHGTITTPIPGQEATTVLNKCKTWSARVGQLKIQESASGQPTITLQLSGVDTKRILDQAGSVDNHGNRVRKLKDILFQQMGIVAEELFAPHEFRWRGTNRKCDVLFNNVRDLPDETFRTSGDGWKLIIDYPFDASNHTAQQDTERLERFRAEDKEARVICWIPSFFNHKAQEDLGTLVRLDHILTENRFPTFVAHLTEVDRAAARAQLQNQRDGLFGQLVSQLEMAYGLRSGGAEYLDSANSLDASEHFQGLVPSLVLQPPVASNFREGIDGLLDQALTSQFPAHPVFEEDALLSKGPLTRVLEVIRMAVRDPNGVAKVEPADRKHMLRVAVPMKLGEMGENRFQIGHFWKQHFNKRIAQHGQAAKPLTVGKLRSWMDEPTPMGVPESVQDLVVLTFAEQTDRFFTWHETALEGEIGGLKEDAVLHETELPSQDRWNLALNRAKHIFGKDTSPLLNAGNLASLAGKIKSVIQLHLPGASALPTRLETVRQDFWPGLTACGRLDTANEVRVMVEKLESARSEVDLINKLVGAELQAQPAVLGASLSSAAEVDQALANCDWKVFKSIRTLADSRKPDAERIWLDLETCFVSDEIAVALSPRFASLRDDAIELLTRTPAVPQPPPQPPIPLPAKPPESPEPLPRPPLPPVTPPGIELKQLYKRSQIEGDSLPEWLPEAGALELLSVHLISPDLPDAGRQRSNLIVVTPTLEALIQSDPGAKIDLTQGELFLPKYGKKLNIAVSPQHNG